MARTPPWKAANPRKKAGKGSQRLSPARKAVQTFGEKGRAALSEFGR